MSIQSVRITQPHLTPFEEAMPYLENIGDIKILAKNGPFHQQHEVDLGKHLNAEYLSLVTNVALASITSLRASGTKA